MRRTVRIVASAGGGETAVRRPQKKELLLLVTLFFVPWRYKILRYLINCSPVPIPFLSLGKVEKKKEKPP